ncbi:MAG: dehydrogenase [Planctomycetaceae bacterium]|nr:dehydrogenase [Planctomycetaceae bacterium]
MYKIRLTADFYDPQGNPRYHDFGLSVLRGTNSLEIAAFESHLPEVSSEQLQGVHGVLVLSPKISAKSLARADDLLVVSRFGVGYDSVDIEACSENDVLVTITKGAVNRSVAEATIAWMLALNHNVFQKDQLVRRGQWDERSSLMGAELRKKTLGVVGLGGIGLELVELLKAFGMNQPMAFDPYAPDSSFGAAGARNVSLDQLLSESDFVSLHCPLTQQTNNLIGRAELGLMKPTAYLLNLARGGVVDEDALYTALTERSIAGAAIDCFENEPVNTPHRFGGLENVILAPHSIAWTNELFGDIGRVACTSILDVLAGKIPHGVVNHQITEKKSFQDKWHRVIG